MAQTQMQKTDIFSVMPPYPNLAFEIIKVWMCQQSRRVFPWRHLLQVIFPAMRMFLKPSRHRATDGSVVELTRLEKLYKIFERC